MTGNCDTHRYLLSQPQLEAKNEVFPLMLLAGSLEAV